MKCPNCGNNYDIKQGNICTSCGFVVRVPDQPGLSGRASNPFFQSSSSNKENSSRKPFGRVPGRRPGFTGIPASGSTGQISSLRSQEQTGSSSLPSSKPPEKLTDPLSSPPIQPDLRATPPLTTGQSSGSPFSPNSQPLRNISGFSQAEARSSVNVQKNASQPLREKFPTTRNDPFKGNTQKHRAFTKPPSQTTGAIRRQQARSEPGARTNGTGAIPKQGGRLFNSGNILRAERYRLQEIQKQQDWQGGVSETHWLAQDLQHQGKTVTICEVIVPPSYSPAVVQAFLKTATMSLTAIGRQPNVSSVWDVFAEQGHNFFVFEVPEGESLQTRVRRINQAMSQQEVTDFCLQMTEVLDLLSAQSPPFIHGMISPENIFIDPIGAHYTLTNFSVVLAGGAPQFVSGIERLKLSPYTSPELARGLIDVRADLYSLIAVAYYVLTGVVPETTNPVSPRQFNPTITPAFESILSKGLRTNAVQRYQRSQELRQDLLTFNSVSGALVSSTKGSSLPGISNSFSGIAGTPGFSIEKAAVEVPPPPERERDSVALALPIMQKGLEIEENHSRLLPRPEEMAPLAQRNDGLNAVLWLVSILVVLSALVILAHS